LYGWAWSEHQLVHETWRYPSFPHSCLAEGGISRQHAFSVCAGHILSKTQGSHQVNSTGLTCCPTIHGPHESPACCPIRSNTQARVPVTGTTKSWSPDRTSTLRPEGAGGGRRQGMMLRHTSGLWLWPLTWISVLDATTQRYNIFLLVLLPASSTATMFSACVFKL
jgi:hypothetical protein